MPVFDPDQPQEHYVKTSPQTEEKIREGMLLSPGEYDFEIIEAKDRVSKSGNAMIEVKLAAFRSNGSRQYVTDYLLEKLAFKLRHFCYAVGLGPQYESGELVATDCFGRCGRVQLKVETQDGFEPKNVVKDYVVPAGAAPPKPATVVPPAQAANADDVPF